MFLARKIMRTANIDKLRACAAKNIFAIDADVATYEFRAQNGILSFWQVANRDEFKHAALAICLAGNSLDTTHIVFIKTEFIKEKFQITPTNGLTAASALRHLHRDISRVSHKDLDVLLTAYKVAADDGRIIRFSKAELIELLKEAKGANSIDMEALNGSLKELVTSL